MGRDPDGVAVGVSKGGTPFGTIWSRKSAKHFLSNICNVPPEVPDFAAEGTDEYITDAQRFRQSTSTIRIDAVSIQARFR
jgi:hypothetical protein